MNGMYRGWVGGGGGYMGTRGRLSCDFSSIANWKLEEVLCKNFYIRLDHKRNDLHLGLCQYAGII